MFLTLSIITTFVTSGRQLSLITSLQMWLIISFIQNNSIQKMNFSFWNEFVAMRSWFVISYTFILNVYVDDIFNLQNLRGKI